MQWNVDNLSFSLYLTHSIFLSSLLSLLPFPFPPCSSVFSHSSLSPPSSLSSPFSVFLSLQQVSQEKEATEDKYKKEKKKRMNTERRLRMAEDSLKRLDKALQDSGVKIDLQIETDVKNLRG